MRLRFCLNKELDKVVIASFLEEKGGGVDFGANILKTHPDLNKIRANPANKKEKIIGAYVDDYYQKNSVTIKRQTDLIQKAWRPVERRYVDVTRKFFGQFPFPPGQYIAYPSIVKCQPRFLEDKTFQFFYRHTPKEAIHTIAHELLHFIFFDFIDKKMKAEIRPLSEEQLWDLSEIFNVLALQSGEYQMLIDPHSIVVYPDHVPYIKQLQSNQWSDAHELIAKIISLLK